MKKKKSGISPLQKYFVTFGMPLVVCAAFFVATYSLLSITKQPFCANSVSCIKDLSVHVENGAPGIFEGHKVFPPQINLADDLTSHSVLGASTSGEKHIYVDLSTQQLFAYEGDTAIFHTFVSTGKWNRTPTGDFRIWIKLRSTRMSGGQGNDAYDLPNVPYTMFYFNDRVPKSSGFSLHGAYWHDNYGHPMSHGCVNMRPIDAKVVYDWADPVTTGYTTYANDKHPGTVVSVCNTFDEKTKRCEQE